MSGPNVVDKAKMVFHYVAKIPARPANTSDLPESNASREMKVCFRHSKHSIKCDINAPCLECDSGLKLYSYDQCRRHLDVVRSEKRFESIEVDRSENMIEKLSDIDDNGKKMAQLLEMIASKQDLLVHSVSDLCSERDEKSVQREAMNCSLKDITKNTLRTLKKAEEMCDKLGECQTAFVELNASAASMASHQLEGHSKLSEVNTSLTLIEGQIAENTTRMKASTDAYAQAFAELNATHDRLFDQMDQMKTSVAGFEASLKHELSCLRNDLRTELQLTRQQVIECENQLRSELSSAIGAVKDEVQSLRTLSQTFANDLKDTLPEKLMDVFGGILMLSADNNRRMDDECGSANASFNHKSDY